MTFRYYIAKVIGDGKSTRTAFRSKLADYSVDFRDWINDVKPFRFCLANCDSATHALLAADADIIVLSPELNDNAAVQAWLDEPVGVISADVTSAIENAGVPVGWIDRATTRRKLWRFISAWHSMMQKSHGRGERDLLDFAASALDNTVASLPTNIHNRVSTWLSKNDIDASWITGATTVKEVLRHIIVSKNPPVMPHGEIVL